MSDAVLVGLFAALSTIVAPCLVLIVKRLTAVHKLVNARMDDALREIAYLKGVIEGNKKLPPP